MFSDNCAVVGCKSRADGTVKVCAGELCLMVRAEPAAAQRSKDKGGGFGSEEDHSTGDPHLHPRGQYGINNKLDWAKLSRLYFLRRLLVL